MFSFYFILIEDLKYNTPFEVRVLENPYYILQGLQDTVNKSPQHPEENHTGEELWV